MIHVWGVVVLPLVWMALTGDFSPANFLIGFLVSSLALWISNPGAGSAPAVVYLRRVWRWLAFAGFFLGELVLASLRIFWDILTPRHRMRPAIIAIPLDLEGDVAVTFLANLITLTPGTLSLDIDEERRVLYVHAMYVDEVEDFRQDIKRRYERRVKELFL